MIVIGGIVLRTSLWLHFDALQPARNWFVEDIYYPTWNRLDGLLAGVILAVWKTYRPGNWARVASRANLVTLGGLATMALAFWLFRERAGLLGNSVGWPVLSLGLALLVFAGAQRDSWIGRRALPGAGWLAAVSFSLYLVHKPVFGLVEEHLGDALHDRRFVAFATYGIASLLAAALLYYLVERPGLQLRDRMLARRRPVPASTAAEPLIG